MTPEEYIKIEQEQRKIINKANDIIAAALRKAEKSKLPKDLRPAAPRDMVEGAIIWHKDFDVDEEGGFYRCWNIIETVQYPNDAFKAYTAEDGCRYGLQGAYVRKEKNDKS